MNLLPTNCSVEDVKNTDTETIFYSYNKDSEDPDSEYSENVVMEMALQLVLRGL